jgi:hypothetical protein
MRKLVTKTFTNCEESYLLILYFLQVIEFPFFFFEWSNGSDTGQRYLTLIDCGLVYTATFQPMGEILRLQRHWQIAEISVHYHNIGGGVGGGTASILVKTLWLGDHWYRNVC